MPELTPSTREAARRIGITDTVLRKAESAGRIGREPDGQWYIHKTRRRLMETADPSRSPLASGVTITGAAAGTGDTPCARLRVAQLALKVEAQRVALDENTSAGCSTRRRPAPRSTRSRGQCAKRF